MSSPLWRLDGPHRAEPHVDPFAVILSFDVEEHDRIEAAAGLDIGAAQKAHYAARLEPSTHWLLEQLDRAGIKATFFIVGQIALSHPRLVRAIADAGHEVGSHSWDHRRVHKHSPASFREDLRLSKIALEQVTGHPVLGYRAPTFSIGRSNPWALDVLADMGFLYDSSIFPVRHDRYGVPDAPRAPFRERGEREEILELPPATLRLWRMNLPVGGGGYFRLFPLTLLRRGLSQVAAECRPAVAMLYFHPWEFDPKQQRLPLGRLSGFRTYVGIGRSRNRLVKLLSEHRYARAGDIAVRLQPQWNDLPVCRLAAGPELAFDPPPVPRTERAPAFSMAATPRHA